MFKYRTISRHMHKCNSFTPVKKITTYLAPFMKLSNAQQHYVQTSYITFHANRKINVQIMYKEYGFCCAHFNETHNHLANVYVYLYIF